MADPTITDADRLLMWSLPENLRWLANNMSSSGYAPCGMLYGQLLFAAADKIEERQSHDRELEALRERCRAGDYLIDRLVAIGAGKCVRDLEEAWGAYRAALASKDADHA